MKKLTALLMAMSLSLFTFGCGDNPSPAGPKPPATPAQLNPNDLKETRAWLARAHEELGLVFSTHNQLRINEVDSRIDEDLKDLEGKRITWELPVNQVGEKQVELEDSFSLPRAYGTQVWLTVSRPVTWGSLPIVLDIGSHISPEQAKQLNKGDMITISGVVTETRFLNEGVGGHFTVITVDEARAVE